MPDNLSLSRLIGNTQMIAITYTYGEGPECKILVKCEQYNMTGSIKDRIAYYVLQKAKEQRKLLPGDYIVLASDGNCAVSYAAIGKAMGYRVKAILPQAVSLEKRTLLKSYGAEIHLANSMEEAIKAAEAYAHLDGVFLPHRQERQHTEAHELFTGREIGHRLLLEDIKPQAFVTGTGSGATLTGVGNYLGKLFPNIKLHPVVAAGSRACGLANWYSKSNEEVLLIGDGDAILMAQKLSSELKLGVGISSGANLLGAIRLQQQNPENKVIVTLFPDDNKKYAGTDLFKEEPKRFGYFAPEIKLLHYEVLNKV